MPPSLTVEHPSANPKAVQFTQTAPLTPQLVVAEVWHVVPLQHPWAQLEALQVELTH